MQSLGLSPTWLDPAHSDFRASRVSTHGNPRRCFQELKCHSPYCLCSKRGLQRFAETRFTRLITQARTYISEPEIPLYLAHLQYIVLLTAEHQAVTFCGTHNHSMLNGCCTKGMSHDATDIGVHASYPQYLLLYSKTLCKLHAHNTRKQSTLPPHMHAMYLQARSWSSIVGNKTVGLIDNSHTVDPVRAVIVHNSRRRARYIG